MRSSGRRPYAERGRSLIGAALLVGVSCLIGPAAGSAREVSVTGSQMDRFGRIVLHFDEATKVQVKAANGVLVIGFAAPARIREERLIGELGSWVSVVRRDPDGTGLRLGLTVPVRPNVLEAGERVFIDLLPQNWTGLPPSLPPAVVAELAQRARAAEAKLKAEERRRAEPAKPVTVRVAQLPRLTRIVVEPPSGTPSRVTDGGGEIVVALDGRLTLDDGGSKPKLAPGVQAFEAVSGTDGVSIRVAAAAGYAASAFREGDTIVVDLSRPAPPEAPPVPTTPAAAPAPPAAQPAPVPGGGKPGRTVAAPAAAGDDRPASAPAPHRETVHARAEPGEGGSSVLFPLPSGTAAAAYERGDRLTVVFDTGAAIDPSALRAGGLDDALRLESASTETGVAVLRFTRTGSRPPQLVAETDGWRLSLAGPERVPPDALKVSRAVDESGQSAVRVALPTASTVRWLRDEDGGRIAVVTALGRPQALPHARSFVEFGLPATLHGVVVEARAEDLKVGLGDGGVVITRDAGLALSPTSLGEAGPGAERHDLVLTREGWARDTAPGAWERYQRLIAEAAEATRSGRAEARFRLAKFLVANGLDVEAAAVLAAARGDDPVFARRRETALLSGIAAARSGRTREARVFLGAEPLAEDPEAGLWRALLDLREGRWASGLAGIGRSKAVTDLSPDDLAGAVRLATLQAAIEKGDFARAEIELAAIDRLSANAVGRDLHDLARARVDEAGGRIVDALKGYERLAEEGGPRPSAEARLRYIRLASRTGAITPEEATDRLEVLAVAWRGDDIEIGTVVELARLYAKAARWRPMFELARYAGRYFPEHPLARALGDETARHFENLMLGPDGEKLPAIETLALYFDFKELTPAGRRGDEMVRRLADRLVELDLLDQAADLLQHQVDKRLTGAARSTIAARLAAIRLMNGKPVPALVALHGTRLPELPEEVRRFRTLLEAKAQADLTRTDLALEILDGETGIDADRLRAAILWGARRWREAGEAVEGLIGTRWQGSEPLSDRDRADTVRAGVAYALAEERVGLERLRQKFGAKMADSPDARTFETLMRPAAAQMREFRAIAAEVARPDALRELLTDWRTRHPDAGLAESAGDARAARADASAAATSPPRG